VGSAVMLTGGFGFLSRLHGLSLDNLVEVEMVLADGRIVIVNANSHPGMFSVSFTSTNNSLRTQSSGGLFVVLDLRLVLQPDTKLLRTLCRLFLQAI
jgi:FAD/FMN-containing dehydrogenase